MTRARHHHRGSRQGAPARPAPSQRPTAAGRGGSLYSLAPPVLGLVVSSPAVVGAFSGTTDPVHAFGIVSVSLSAAWMLSALGARVAATVPARTADPRTTGAHSRASDGGQVPGGSAQDPVAIGRIEPVQVPASEAIPGTPDSQLPETEGPLA